LNQQLKGVIVIANRHAELTRSTQFDGRTERRRASPRSHSHPNQSTGLIKVRFK
jgi:hypothetical protein